MNIKKGLRIDPRDTVGVVLEEVKKGEYVKCGDVVVQAREDIPMPHKIALVDISKGNTIYKYGEIIGYATQDISKGDHVHVHNLDSENIMKK